MYIFISKALSMLTPKQQKALDAITEYIKHHGESPTLEELQTMLELKNKHSVVQFVEYLDKKGYISRGRGYRSIQLGDRIVAAQMTIPVPILGTANAGKALMYAEESNQGQLLISRNLIKGDVKQYFCVKIQGTSMNQFSINGKKMVNGSVALVDSTQKIADNPFGAYLCIVNGCATVKKIKREGGNVYLLPDTDDVSHSPIILSEDDSFEMNGKVIDVFNFSIE